MVKVIRFKMAALVMVLFALLAGVVPVMAATTQDITVSATPAFISISNAPNSFNFGVVAASSTPNTTTDWFTITNTSTVAIDVDIRAVTGWEGGANDWSWGPAGVDTGRLEASAGTGLYDLVITNVDTDYELIDNLAALTDDDWELELIAPSSFTYGNAQQITVRLTASAFD